MVKAVLAANESEQGMVEAVAATKPRPRKSALHQLLAPIASLRLTVVLFALSLVLVFCGTLAQMNAGNYSVVQEYFRSVLVWIPLQLFVQFCQVFFNLTRDAKLPGNIPFPGGWVLGGLLLVNLLAAHLVRFKISWKRSGILLIHSGLVVLMVGELLTGLAAVEAKMSLAQGESVNFVDVSHALELAIIDSSDAKVDRVAVIPSSILRKGGVIHHEALPVDVDVVEYLENSNLVEAHPGDTIDTRMTDDGNLYKIVGKTEESGVDTSSREDAPAVRVTLRKKGSSESLGTFFLSLWHYPNFTNRMLRFTPEQFTLDGTTYAVELRPKREYKPYSIHLKEFHHDVFIGTDTPRNFSSLVQLTDSTNGEDREANISMNHPLRYQGEAMYQSSFFPDDSGTVLQVVRNPAWLMPYVSCALVSLGMAVHFGIHLVGFLRRKGVIA